jgi:ERCC4-type nuclease
MATVKTKDNGNHTFSNIVVDSREQRPYAFPNAIIKKLDAGDYSIHGLEAKVAIERKSLEDLIHTLLTGRQRFRRELIKLQSYDFAAVIVEADIHDILAGDYRSEIAPDALMAIICKLMVAYSPVHWIFASDRPHACAVVRKLLENASVQYGG